MNEAEKKKAELVEEARQETGAAGEDAQKYTMRSARLAIQRKETAIRKRKEKITQLELDNQEDQEAIRQLETICTRLQSQEIMQKLSEIHDKGATVETEQINRALELLALVGDAVEALSVEQMALAVQSAASQAAIAAEAQDAYEQKKVCVSSEDTE
ncbi:MAG: hypothetical protein IKG82_05940 [Oscillospiraceae bacterium]|nr:hypothetical protein [Oscillospiraceae bacterium]MBR4200560.1 hypothetical protein [Oscillospiraceae bacterium]